MNFKSVFFMVAMIFVNLIFFQCATSEEKNADRLKKEDPLFYDTNNEIIKLIEVLQIGLSEEEFLKMFRIEDPAMVIVGRFGPIRKQVVNYFIEKDSIGYFYMGDITAVPEYYIAEVRIKDHFVTYKQLYPENLKKISRFRDAQKYYPSAKPVFYNLGSDSIAPK